MKKVIFYNELYDYYQDLLTESQRSYYEDYYFNNFTYHEIAENKNVSRNAAFNQVKAVEEKLEYYEKNLKLHKKGKEIRDLIKNIDPDIKEKINNLI